MASTIVTKNGSGAPLAGDLVQGELAVDLTNKRLYTEDSGGTVIEVGTNPAVEITANAGIALPDGQKATFGTSDDLQIYHDGSHSYVRDAGTGDLYVGTNGTKLWFGNIGTGEAYAEFNDNGAVSLRYDAATKLATTSTGVDVTGTVTADGLTVDGSGGDIRFTGSVGQDIVWGSASTDYAAIRRSDPSAQDVGLTFHTTTSAGTDGAPKRLNIDHNGDISFYEDTGTTAKFFWDASAESLGIGTASPVGNLHVVGNAVNTITTDNDLSFDMSASNFFKCTPTGTGTLTFTNITAGQSGNIWLDNSAGVVISAASTTYISAADLTKINTAGVYFLSYYSDGTNVLVSASSALTSAGA